MSKRKSPAKEADAKATDAQCPNLSGFVRPGEFSAGTTPENDPVDPLDGLTARQALAVEAMLREPSMARVAEAAGVSERTLSRWMREPMFRAAMLRRRRDAFAQALGLTQRYAPMAVGTLVKVMNETTASASAKVAAAGSLLKFGRDGIELDDLAERVELLERHIVTVKPKESGDEPREADSKS